VDTRSFSWNQPSWAVRLIFWAEPLILKEIFTPKIEESSNPTRIAIPREVAQLDLGEIARDVHEDLVSFASH